MLISASLTCHECALCLVQQGSNCTSVTLLWCGSPEALLLPQGCLALSLEAGAACSSTPEYHSSALPTAGKKRPPGSVSPPLDTLWAWPSKTCAELFSSAGFIAAGEAWGHGFYCVSDILHVCKGQTFNGPSVHGLLMVYCVAGKTAALIMFLAAFSSNSLKQYMCDVKFLIR